MRGFVLLIMLVYLQIFSLLAVQGVAALGVQKKLLYHQMLADQRRREMLRLLTQIDSTREPQCVVVRQAPAALITRHLSWWRRWGCRLSEGKNYYFYVRERLETDICAQFNDESNQVVAPAYYRNTLLYVSGLSHFQSMLVQDTIAAPGQVPPSCNGGIKRVNPGRQMLRWL